MRRLGLNLRAISALVVLTYSPAPAVLADEAVDDPLLFQWDGWKVKLGVDGAVQTAGETNSWWNLTDAFPPGTPYDPDMSWTEGYIKPSAKLEYAFDGGTVLYGGLAAVASYTWGTDIFDAGNTGAITLENAYGGLRHVAPHGLELDLSAGMQDYEIGSGMLIQMGGGNGYERGALLLSPRSAWDMAAIAREKLGAISFEQFYLNPSELESGDSLTEMIGAHVRYDQSGSDYAGLAYINVIKSEYPSLEAPLNIIPNGREGMNALYGYFRTQPLTALPTLWVSGDLAYEWNERINQSAWGGQAEIGYVATSLPFTPAFSYAFRYFSGDDPDTAQNERFDSLFYEGSPTAWATGGNASLAFYNSNIMAHRFALDLVITETDFVKARYWHVMAAQENSPIQFGQGAEVSFENGTPIIIVGVQDPHLSDDFYLEYTRIITQNLFLTAGGALSIPGEGLSEVADGKAENWWGGYVNLTVSY